MENEENKPNVEETPKAEEKEINSLEEAKAIVQSLKEQNTEMKANLARAEELEAIRMVSGKSSAGQTPPPAKEETPLEYKERVMSGGL
jgi:cell shape-determining protein MreC|tara:strand:+ start:142 stop:405 length:264 start_codon:yes stop_codon:yes gene_type:complete